MKETKGTMYLIFTVQSNFFVAMSTKFAVGILILHCLFCALNGKSVFFTSLAYSWAWKIEIAKIFCLFSHELWLWFFTLSFIMPDFSNIFKGVCAAFLLHTPDYNENLPLCWLPNILIFQFVHFVHFTRYFMFSGLV